jgi:hypothetical protein
VIALSIVSPFVVGIGIVDCPGMPGVKSSSESSSHFRISICFLSSLAKIIISPDVLVLLLKEFFEGLWWLPCKILDYRSWPKPLDYGLNNNFIGHCRRLSSPTQKPSDIRLQVLLMVLRALKQGLSSDWLRLKALEAGD